MALVAMLAPAAFPRAVVAAPAFVVDSTLDEPDAAPGLGKCSSTPSAKCTLRAAIMEANRTSGASIMVPAGNYKLKIPPSGTDDDSTGDLNITSNMTIAGAGLDVTSVDGNQIDRIFNIGPNTTCTLSGMQIFNGAVGPTAFGGGIFNAGILTLDQVLIDGNSGGAGGGGIYNQSAAILTVYYSDIEGNSAAGLGGGILNWYGNGTVTIENTIISSNIAGPTEGGGGFANLSGSVTISNSTISGNTSYQDGGGIINGGGTMKLNNSTVWKNSAKGATDGWGGGIANAGILTIAGTAIYSNTAVLYGGGIGTTGGGLAIVNSTIGANQADTDGGGIWANNSPLGYVNLYNVTITQNYADADLNGTGTGGGIFNVTPAEPVAFANSIVALNFETLHAGPVYIPVPGDCSGTLASLDYNLLASVNASHCTISGVTTHDLLTSPELGPLVNNGGPTPTYALLPGSPAIDAGNPSGCSDGNGGSLTTDQRGSMRPVGPRCDIGAFEYGLFLYLPLISH
jgi:CSLREA domain-containing protein